MPADIARLRAEVNALGLAYATLFGKASAPAPSNDDIVAAARGFREIWNKVVNLLPELGQTSTDFSAFFKTVGASVIQAQQELDRASRDYLDGVPMDAEDSPDGFGDGPHDHVPPTVFRIPRVSAEMKFSLGEVSTKGVGLVFYSTSEESRREHQQSVSFEIVAAPPPPDYTRAEAGGEVAGVTSVASVASPRGARARRAAVRAPVATVEATAGEAHAALLAVMDRLVASSARAEDVLADAQRRAVLAEVEAWQPKDAKAARAVRRDALLAQRDRLVIIDDPAQNKAFLVLAEQGRRPALAVWELSRAPRSLTLAYWLPAAAAARRALAPLIGALATLADQRANPPRSGG